MILFFPFLICNEPNIKYLLVAVQLYKKSWKIINKPDQHSDNARNADTRWLRNVTFDERLADAGMKKKKIERFQLSTWTNLIN